MNNAQSINQDSGIFEYYTPGNIVGAARRAMGGSIDLDPASSITANKQIRATQIYTLDDDGLSQPWHGRVWLNHPFSRAGNAAWIAKLIGEYRNGNIAAACCITYAATSEKWFQPLMVFAQCFLSPRTNYYLPDGTLKRGVTKGSVVTYLGQDSSAFRQKFQGLGMVKY